jgi:DNA-binding MarR family transcriptional regulator
LLSADLESRPRLAGRAALQRRASELFLHFIQEINAGPAGPWLDLQLTMPQLKMLFVVDWLGPAPMHRLAHRLHISVSAATGLVDRLVEHGLVEREHDTRDRRVVRVSSAPAGRALVVRLRSAGSERLERILGHLETEDLRCCARAMELMSAAAEAELRTEPLDSGRDESEQISLDIEEIGR